MTSNLRSGYLVIADISGYTGYLVDTELDHAQGILADLLEQIAFCFQPVLTVAKLLGDAVFAVTPAERVTTAEILLDLLDVTYARFRGRQAALQRQTLCPCKACAGIHSLDLKFVVHRGKWAEQAVMGGKELAGRDVILAYRLLKNSVIEKTGWKAYALFTEESVAGLGEAFEATHRHRETYEGFGEVPVAAVNIGKRHSQAEAARREVVTSKEADFTMQVKLRAAPAVVWEWINDPAKRIQWEQLVIQSIFRPGGRLGAGARSHCLHGKDLAMVETILDWRPFEYVTVEKVFRNLGFTTTLWVTLALTQVPGTGNTMLTMSGKAVRGVPRMLFRATSGILLTLTGIERNYRRLARLIAEQDVPSRM